MKNLKGQLVPSDADETIEEVDLEPILRPPKIVRMANLFVVGGLPYMELLRFMAKS